MLAFAAIIPLLLAVAAAPAKRQAAPQYTIVSGRDGKCLVADSANSGVSVTSEDCDTTQKYHLWDIERKPQ